MSRRFGVRLRPSDKVILAYLVVESVLILIARERLPQWPWYLGRNIAMIAGVVVLSSLFAPTRKPLFRVLRDWYPALYLLLIFATLRTLIPAVNPRVYDDMLLDWDRAIFGKHPGVWMNPIATPLLTEILRACWLSYFVLPLLAGIPLYLRKSKDAFHEAVLALMLGWLLSFLGYYTVPAWGPGYFPDRVPAPECVHADGITQSVALTLFTLEGRTQDIFPSGHTMIALLVLWLARRHRVRGWPLLIPIVSGLVMGTVYLRYHYGVDILAGVLLAALVIGIAPRWQKRCTSSS